MAKKNIIAQYVRHDLAHELKLRVYENKQGRRGSLINAQGKVVDTAMFYYKDCDADLYRVKEYFGFTEDNSYQISNHNNH